MRIPDHHATRTPGGVDVVVVDWPGAPFAELRVLVPSRRDDDRTTVLAHLTARMLALHPDDPDAAAAVERMLRRGGRLTTAPQVDRVTVSATVPADEVPATLADVVDRVGRRSWRPETVAAMLRAEAGVLAQASAYREVALHAEVSRRRWGAGHPYARTAVDPASLDLVTVDALAAPVGGEVDGLLTLHGATVLVVGDVGGPSDLVARLVDVLAAAQQRHPATARPLPALPVDRPSPGEVRLPPRPGATAVLRVAAAAPPRQDADHPAVMAACMTLGGYFGSRLTTELRERRGDVYGVGAGFEVLQGGTTMVLSLDCTDDRLEGVRDVVGETLDDLVAHGPTAEELAAGTAYATNAATVGISSPAALASAGATVVFGGDDLGMWERHAALARRLAPDDVARAAQRYLAAGRRIEVVSPTSDGDR